MNGNFLDAVARDHVRHVDPFDQHQANHSGRQSRLPGMGERHLRPEADRTHGARTMKHLWSITILHPNFHPKLGQGNMIEQDYDGAARNSDLIFRLIDDVAEGKSSVSFAIMECRIPDLMNHKIGRDHPVHFRIICTPAMASELRTLGYKVIDRDQPDMDDGTTWSEFMSLFNHLTRDQKLLPHWDAPMRLTDDNDPHAPWFRVVGIKEDDDGPFVAIEEIEP